MHSISHDKQRNVPEVNSSLYVWLSCLCLHKAGSCKVGSRLSSIHTLLCHTFSCLSRLPTKSLLLQYVSASDVIESKASLSLSSCVVNSHQTMTDCDLRCDFWCILHEEVQIITNSYIQHSISIYCGVPAPPCVKLLVV